MESRMEKYYSDDLSDFTRTKKNEELYKNISGEMSELDNLPVSNNVNEIDMNGLKSIISSREDYRENRDNLVNKPSPIRERVDETDTNKIYDINVLLENAKSEINKSAEVTNDKKISANFLTSLEEVTIPNADDAIEISDPIVKEKEKPISNTDSLPLDILMDLKGDDNTVVTDPIVKEEVTMIKKIKDGETFYSGSFNFSKKDFEEDDDEVLFDEEPHKGIKIFFLILGILIFLGAMAFIVVNYVL